MRVARFEKALTIALELEVYGQIQRITDEQRISMAEWVRNAINTALKKAKQDGGSSHDE
jgi:hypothetical protein